MPIKINITSISKDGLLGNGPEGHKGVWMFDSKLYTIKEGDLVVFNCNGELVASGIATGVDVSGELHKKYCSGLNDKLLRWEEIIEFVIEDTEAVAKAVCNAIPHCILIASSKDGKVHELWVAHSSVSMFAIHCMRCNVNFMPKAQYEREQNQPKKKAAFIWRLFQLLYGRV